MFDEEVIKPICKVLYRQSSTETRLSPVHFSEESEISSSEDEGVSNTSVKPKVLEATPKVRINILPAPTCSNSLQTNLVLNNTADKLNTVINSAKEASDNKIQKKSNIKEIFISETEKIFVESPTEKCSKTKSMSPLEDQCSDVDINKNADTLMKVETNMATLRPKSPRQGALKSEKEESFWEKIGTLGRKKRIKEVQEVQAVQEEGKYAIDSPSYPLPPDMPPEHFELVESEERCMVDPKTWMNPKFIELSQVLKDWVNDELASQRIIVKDLAEDLYDGQVLQKLLEKLTGEKLDVPEVTLSEEGQKQKLHVVLTRFNRELGISRHNKWSVEAIHSKNIVPIMHLLVALARHFRPPVRLPENVSAQVVVVTKSNGQLITNIVKQVITTEYDDVGMRCERDAFDTLFDHAPDKLQVVKKSLVTFVNKHLNKINLEVTELETQFHDGVYLIMLMGSLEGFFVPLYSFYPTPKEFDQKVHNVAFSFELMEEVGLQRPKARPEDVVNMDLKSTLRVLYNLFLKYKNLTI